MLILHLASGQWQDGQFGAAGRKEKGKRKEDYKEISKKEERGEGTWTVEGRLKNIRKIASLKKEMSKETMVDLFVIYVINSHLLNLNLYAIPVLQSIMYPKKD